MSSTRFSVLVSFSAVLAFGQCPNGVGTIFFANGVWTRPSDSYWSTQLLKRSVRDRISQTGAGITLDCLVFRQAYDSTFIDTNNQGINGVEVTGQLITAIQQRGLDVVATLGSFLSGAPGTDWLAQVWQSAVSGVVSAAAPDLVTEEGWYINAGTGGNKAIVVAHSQGNLYLNEVYPLVVLTSNLQGISVASPLPHTIDSSRRFTLSNDLILTISPGALGADITNIPPCGSRLYPDQWNCHKFDESYMSGNNGQAGLNTTGNYTGPAIEDAVIAAVLGITDIGGSIFIQTNLDGEPWSGSFAYAFMCPGQFIGESLMPNIVFNEPTGTCALSIPASGPPSSSLVNVSPSLSQTLIANGSITYTLNYKSNPPTSGFTISSAGQSATDGQSLNVADAPTSGEIVTFDGTGRSSAVNGATVMAWQWSLDGSIVATTSTFSKALGIGTHAISLLVTDTRGAQSAPSFGTVTISASSGSGLYSYSISTVAGNPQYILAPGYSGDGGPAIEAQLWYPAGLAVDQFGNLYIAEINNVRVRKVDVSGVITTVAGRGLPRGGYGIGSCDDCPAVDSFLDWPLGVAVDSSEKLYIADFQSVREVSTNGIITTTAGIPYDYPFCACPLNSGDGGPAINAELIASGVAVDSSGSIYIADGNGRVRKIVNGVITTVAGIGSYGADQGYSGDGGPATSAELNQPSSVAVDTSGNIYIADSLNNRVRKVSINGIITTLAGNGVRGYSGDGGPATAAELNEPMGVAVDTFGNVFIADTDNGRVRRVAPDGVITTIAGTGSLVGYSGDGGPATNAPIPGPYGLAIDASGRIYVSDAGNNLIRLLTPSN